MLRNFFVVALRNVIRYRTFSGINILGLTLGIGCALFIFLIVQFEQSYDQYHPNIKRIYRVNAGSPNTTLDEMDTGTPQGVAPILRAEFPEVELAAVAYKLNPEQSQIEYNHELTRVNHLFYAQPEFFEMFDFQWIQGSPRKSLSAPNQGILTETMAKRFFNGDAMNKTIRVNNNIDVVITGIIKDPPVNSDFPFEVVMSHATLEKDKNNYDPNGLEGWNSYYHTYVMLRQDANADAFDAKLKQMVATHLGQEKADKFLAFKLIPVSDIHFLSGNFNDRTISRATLFTLGFIGLLIVIIACINFTNLSTAQAIRRSREVGIRKTLGSSRKILVLQFLGETFLITLVAVALAYVLVTQLTLASKRLTEIPLSTDVLVKPETFLFLTGTLIVVTILSGFYPAFVLSGFQPVRALKNTPLVTSLRGIFVRKGLIAFQFMISQVLIVCTLIVIRQVDHFSNLPLGFNKEAVVAADIPDSNPVLLSTLKNKLIGHPAIKGVTYSLNTPSATINKWWSNLEHISFGNDHQSAELKFIDSAYMNMYDIRLVAGTLRIPADTGVSVVVNEELVKTIGIQKAEDAIGEPIKYWNVNATIVGVVKDFQTVTLAEGMHPVILTWRPNFFQKMSVKIDMKESAAAVALVEKSWKETFPQYYFKYSFLEDDLATFYEEERKISRLLISFAIVAVGIGCIGLFGLIMFTAMQRTKEIGIRKILGATITNITTLLSKDFIILVAVAGAVACPIAYFAVKEWLAGFANKIGIIENGWVFPVAILMAVVFALITVGYQALMAAKRNPTESLRND